MAALMIALLLAIPAAIAFNESDTDQSCLPTDNAWSTSAKVTTPIYDEVSLLSVSTRLAPHSTINAAWRLRHRMPSHAVSSHRALAMPPVTTSTVALESSDDCDPDVITLHCLVSVPMGILIWVVFGGSVAFCCCAAYCLFRSTANEPREGQARRRTKTGHAPPRQTMLPQGGGGGGGRGKSSSYQGNDMYREVHPTKAERKSKCSWWYLKFHAIPCMCFGTIIVLELVVFYYTGMLKAAVNKIAPYAVGIAVVLTCCCWCLSSFCWRLEDGIEEFEERFDQIKDVVQAETGHIERMLEKDVKKDLSSCF